MDLNIALEASSIFIEEVSSEDSTEGLQDLIRRFIERRLISKDNKISEDFQSGLDWINVSKALSLSKELRGKVVVLDFFTYCCINCMHIFPQLKALENDFTVQDGLVVIGVHSPKFLNEHTTANVKAAVERYEISHPVVNDHEEHLWNALGINCWPTIVIIGPNSEILLYLLGESHEKLLKAFVKEAISLFDERGALSLHTIPEVGVHCMFREVHQLYYPGKVCAISTPVGNILAVADSGNHRILIIDDIGNVQHVIGGNQRGFKDGNFEEVRFHTPQGLAFTDPWTLFVADTENHALRRIDLDSGRVETVAGDGSQGHDKEGGGVGVRQPLSSPWDVAVLNPSVLLIAMAGSHQVWAYFIKDTVFWKKRQYSAGVCAAVAGSGREENRNNTYPMSAGFAQPSGLAVAEAAVYVADSESSAIRAVQVADGRVSAVVGGLLDPQNLFAFGDVDGSGLEARLQHPLGVAWSEHNKLVYVCDSYNHKLKAVDPFTRQCSTFTDHSFSEPGGLCVVDNLLYVADTNNHCIKVVNLDDHSVETMELIFKKREVPQTKQVAPVHSTDLTFSSRGGKLTLRVGVVVAAGIKVLPDSPAIWTMDLPEGWKEAESEMDGVMDPRLGHGSQKIWTLIVPANKPDTSDNLRPQCRLFYCFDNLCSARVFPFHVTITYRDPGPSNLNSNVGFYFSL